MRELTKEEKQWLRKLKKVIGEKPNTLDVRQSNETSQLLYYDSKTGLMIDSPLSLHILGFMEQDS